MKQIILKLTEEIEEIEEYLKTGINEEDKYYWNGKMMGIIYARSKLQEFLKSKHIIL